MIFITRAIDMKLMAHKAPIEEFMEHELYDKGADNYKRKNYFIRYIGFEKSQKDYVEMVQRIDQKFKNKPGYLRIQEMKRQFSIEDTHQAIAQYEQWLRGRHEKAEQLIKLSFPMTFKNQMMELSQKVAFEKVMTCFEHSHPHANASIKKNFGVSLLSFSSHYLPMIFGKDELVCGKIVYIGELKRQELLFLYFLNLLGCDVLYLNPKEDIKEKYPECENFSTLYRGTNFENIVVPKAMDQEVQPTRPVVGSTAPNAPMGIGNGQRGSIHLEHRQDGPDSSKPQPAHHSVSTQPVKPASGLQRPQPVKPVNGLQRPQAHKIPDKELSYEELAQLSTAIVMIGIADRKGQVHGSGSGVIINSKGYILTNYHVVKHGVRYLVKFENEETTYETERVIKYHPEYDLAIIKVEKNCKSLPIYEGNGIVRGQKVVAIGSPLGLFNSVSDGIVSAFRKMEGGHTMIQFTAPISHGSSGGALLDLYGRVIGICTAGFDDGQNLNLAVDSECIRFFAANYINE